MGYLLLLAKATGIGLAIWLLGRAIRTAHPLDRTAATIRWTVVIGKDATGSHLSQLIVLGPDRANTEGSSSFAVVSDAVTLMIDATALRHSALRQKA